MDPKIKKTEMTNSNINHPTKESRPRGRPLVTGELLETKLQVRVSKKLGETCKDLGGTDFLRQLIESGTQHALALRRLSPARPAKDAPVDIKFLEMTVQCGFPSPAADYSENELSITDYFVRNQDATMIIEARGDSMIDAGIYEGDILIIDRSVEPRPGDIVLAYLHGDFTLKRLEIVDGKPELHAQNNSVDYPVIQPSEYDDFQIEGVLVSSGRRYRK